MNFEVNITFFKLKSNSTWYEGYYLNFKLEIISAWKECKIPKEYCANLCNYLSTPVLNYTATKRKPMFSNNQL